MNTDSNRAILVVLDGCGAGAAPDAREFGDPMTVATVRNVWNAVGGFSAPNLTACGFLSACGIEGHPSGIEGFRSQYGRIQPIGMGKDSVTGHWEMMGAIVDKAFPTYPAGFPPEVVSEFESRIGSQVLGNVAASGTEIIAQLGGKHLETGRPILYTSADSVFQIACHESLFPPPKLYEICLAAREMLVEPHNVQRVIARPFVGDPESGFERTTNRRDFPIPAQPNLVDTAAPVLGIGVVPELFAHRGFVSNQRTQSNAEHEIALMDALSTEHKFIFANFEDFDMLYGHRNDAPGFAKCLEQFDVFLGRLLGSLSASDLLILTSDHGNDPTNLESTDHTREYLPVVHLQHGQGVAELQTAKGLDHVGMAVASHLGLEFSVRFPSEGAGQSSGSTPMT